MIEIYYPLEGGDASPSLPELEGSPLRHNPDHTREGLDRLLEQFKRKPLLEVVLGAQLDEIQQLEDALWQLLTERWIDTAEGEQLDVIGRIVGLKRNANMDAAYRLLLKVEILSLRSHGTGEELLVLATQLFGPDGFTFLDVDDLDPSGAFTHATALIETVAPLELAPGFYMRLFRRAAAAGVRLLLEYPAVDPAESFTFSSSAAEELSDAQGFGSVTDPTIGGRFAGITA